MKFQAQESKLSFLAKLMCLKIDASPTYIHASIKFLRPEYPYISYLKTKYETIETKPESWGIKNWKGVKGCVVTRYFRRKKHQEVGCKSRLKIGQG